MILFGIAVIVILYLLSRLLYKNPFHRVLWKPRHSTRYDSTGVLEISITAKKYSDSVLKDAVLDAYYSYPNAESICICTQRPLLLDMDQIFLFPHIKRLDLSNFKRTQTNEFSVWDFPLESIVIPKETDRIQFWTDLQDLEYITIPCDKVISAHPAYLIDRKHAIKVSKPLRIIVPESLVNAYRNDESWKSIRFVSESGELYSLEFSPSRFLL